MKGIILAGGQGTRLAPFTKMISKHLLPVYNKPMISFPIEILKNAGITDTLLIVSTENADEYMKLLGSGRDAGVKFTYALQDKPEGIAHAFILGEDFIGDDSVAVILGDNYFDDAFIDDIKNFSGGAKIFLKEVPNPTRYGVAEVDQNLMVVSIEEKPADPKSPYAISGFYLYDNSVVGKAKQLKPSARGELEISDMNRLYLEEGKLSSALLPGRWNDMGTFESWFQVSSWVRDKELGL